jgi:hypothetical protein
MLRKHCQVITSVELPLSTRILPTSLLKKWTEFLPMLALMTRGSLFLPLLASNLLRWSLLVCGAKGIKSASTHRHDSLRVSNPSPVTWFRVWAHWSLRKWCWWHWPKDLWSCSPSANCFMILGLGPSQALVAEEGESSLDRTLWWMQSAPILYDTLKGPPYWLCCGRS